MSKEISTRIFNRSDTAANWAANNPILGMGEIGYETDTGYIKIGNETDHWNDLNYPFSINTVPIGSISLFAGETAPTGYLLCQGQALSTTEYPDLFAVIGYTYGGSGDNFYIPNLQGKIPVGYDSTQTEFDTLGKTGGEKTHTLTIDEMPEHSHSGSIRVALYKGGSTEGIIDASISNYLNSPDHYSYTTDKTGSSQPHNNLQPYITLNYIIYAGV